MLKPATVAGNEIHLKPLDLTVENLPTFGGVTMVPLDEYVQRNTADVLSGGKIIVGDGSNKLKIVILMQQVTTLIYHWIKGYGLIPNL